MNCCIIKYAKSCAQFFFVNFRNTNWIESSLLKSKNQKKNPPSISRDVCKHVSGCDIKLLKIRFTVISHAYLRYTLLALSYFDVQSSNPVILKLHPIWMLVLLQRQSDKTKQIAVNFVFLLQVSRSNRVQKKIALQLCVSWENITKLILNWVHF